MLSRFLKTEFLIAALTITAAAITAFMLLPADDTLSDEGMHWLQILRHFKPGFEGISTVATNSAYHAVTAAIAYILSLDSIPEIRFASFLAALSALALFYLILGKLNENNPAPICLQFFLCPLIFPFFFLIYADIVSLAPILLALMLTLYKRYHLAAIASGVMLFFGQMNIVWVLLFWILILGETGFFHSLKTTVSRPFGKPENPPPSEWFASIKATWIFIVVFIGFVIFLYTKGGIAIGDVAPHPPGKPYPTQIFLLLFAIFFLFIPQHIRNAPAIWRMLKTTPLLPLSGAVLFVVYTQTFDASHQYNNPLLEFYLRNRLLGWIGASYLNLTLSAIPVLWAFYSLLVMPLREKRFYWLYPLTIMALLPVALIEQRYFIVPLVLFMLFRKPSGDRIEYLNAALYVPATLFIFIGIADVKFFL